MHKLGVCTALALSGVTASCAERIVNPAVIPKPPPSIAAPKPQPHERDARRQAETIAEDTRKHSAIRSRQVLPSASVGPAQPSELQSRLPQAAHQPQGTSISPNPPAVAALPPLPEHTEPSAPITALMPPLPEPAEATFLTVPPNVERPSPPEPAPPSLPAAAPEATMPPPPEPAEPSFPVAALMPPLPEPAEPSLPSQDEIAAESPISIPFPELPAPLSLYPRFEWENVTGSLSFPLAEAPEANSEKRVPSLIRTPWPLSSDTP
jgi:hypothetical protein